MLQFLDIWNVVMFALGIAGGAAAVFILLSYLIKAGSIKDYKEKYDYISLNEIRRLNLSIGVFAAGLAAFINSTYRAVVSTDEIWLFVRLFISICFGALFYYIFSLALRYLYPSKLAKKLRKLRYHPRKSPAGNTMKLLSEDEEDVHLDEGMQAEENVFSVDYDVWVDEKTGYVKVEKYPGYLEALKCNSCGFQTMRIVKEEIVSHPTRETKGQLIKYYQCAYCKAKRKKLFKIATLKAAGEPYELPREMHFKQEKNAIERVRIEIQTSGGQRTEFEFSNLREAKNFIDHFEEEKIGG